MPNPADQLASRAIRDTMDLIQLANGEVAQATTRLHLLENSLKRLILGGNLTDVNRTLYRNGRANKVAAEAGREIDKAYRAIGREVQSYLRGLAKAVAEQQAAGGVGGVAGKDLRAVVDRLLVQGSKVDAWVRKLASDARHRFATQLRQAVALRQTEDQIIKGVIGSARFRRTLNGRPYAEHGGGFGDVGRNQMETFIQTATAELAGDVQEQSRESAGDQVRGVQAIAVLDNRTTPLCRSRHGAAWDKDGNPLPESPVKIPFPGPPPWHWNCRTILVPITGKDLVTDFTFEDWFGRQPEADQLQMLGPNRFGLWRKGLISFQDMVDRKGHTLTLDELRRRIKKRK